MKSAKIAGWVAVSLFTMLGAACSADPGTSDGGRHDGSMQDGSLLDGRSGNDGASTADAAPDGSTQDVPPADAVCGANRFTIAPTPPNVLILLDRSCSMRRTVDGPFAIEGDGTSKWEIAVGALRGLTARYPTQVRWGIISLPRNGNASEDVSCTGSPVCGGSVACPQVAPGPGTAPSIDAEVAGISPFPSCANGTQSMITPIYGGLQASLAVSQLHDATRDNFVLLVTDGQESCNTTEVVPGVTALRTAGIRTAVVGFGTAGSGGVDPAQLDAMAMAGGLPAMGGANQYYAADNAASLQTAFTSIIGSTLPCTFALSAPPSDVSLLHVYVDAVTELTRDTSHAMGWDYDPATHSISVYGATCDSVRALRYSQLDAIESCPGGMMPPPPTACHHNGGSCDADSDCCNLEGLACDVIHHVCIPAPG